MSATDEREDAPPPLWEVVPIAEFKVPTSLNPDAVRKRFLSFRGTFGLGAKEAPTPLRAEADLRALPQVRLANIAPPIDWSAGAAALEPALGSWLTGAAAPIAGRIAGRAAERAAVQFLIGAPFSGHAQMLTRWAEVHGARLVTAPDPEVILTGDPRWLDDLVNSGSTWVLPRLEHCYLRHTQGLWLVRRIFELALTGRLGRGLIGCDSWAWAYLQRIWPMPAVPALTLQAFDGHRLSAFFLTAARAARRGGVRVCHARTGESVLPDPAQLDAGGFEINSELKRLAAHCRGNPGLAWHYWRTRLRSAPDQDEAAADGAAPKNGQATDDHVATQANPPASAENGQELVWLTAGIDDPVLPTETGEEVVLVLHALLLHDGSPESLLPELLPLSHGQIIPILLRMRDIGLVEAADGRWRVAPLGYITAREALRARDYLCDQF